MYILIAYLVWGVIGKSNASFSAGFWRYYQIGNVLFSSILIVFIIASMRMGINPHRPARSVSHVLVVLGVFLAWGTVCCAAQEVFFANFVCFAIYATMILALFVVPYVFIDGSSLKRFLDIITVFVCLGTLSSLVVGLIGLPDVWPQDRLAGIYECPITCTNMSVIGLMLLLVYAVRPVGNRLLRTVVVGMIVVSVWVVILTRTRGGYVCLLLAPTCFAVHHLHQRRKDLAPAALKVLFGGAVLVGGVLLALSMRPELVGDIRRYARVDIPIEEVVQARTNWWNPERHLRLGNVFGKGFLATYDWRGPSDSESGYDRDRNPHNTFITCALCYGVPGLSIFAAFMLCLLYLFWARSGVLAALGFTVLVYSIARSMGSNHLLGFGLPMDRFSWLLMGISLHFAGIPRTSRQVCTRHARWLRQQVSPGIARTEGNSIADHCGNRALRVTTSPRIEKAHEK